MANKSELRAAAAYIRVSTDDQIEYSPDSQIKAIYDYAERNGFILSKEHIFIDEGISGRKAEKRPQFMKMIGLAKSKPKPFEAILLWKFSRFARNREDSIVYKSMLRKQLGIDVISVSENLGDDKISVLIEALIEAMDEFYSINLSEEVKRGMTEKAHRGEAMTIAPYGYEIKDKKLITKPSEANIIQSVFKWYNDGKGILMITKLLNAMGIKSKRGNLIEYRTVEYWLNNPVYNGRIRWTPTGKTHRNYNNPDTIISDGEHEKIINDEIWKRTQAKITETKSKYAKYSKPNEGYKLSHWLVSIMRCGKCGKAMCNFGGYMQCADKARGKCEGVKSFATKKYEALILKALDEYSSETKESENISFGLQRRIKNTGAKKEEDARLLDKLNKKLARIKESYEVGIDTLAEYKNAKERIQKEIASAEKIQKSETAETNIAAINLLPLKEQVGKIVEDLKSPTLTMQAKSDLLHTVVKQITKYNDSISIDFLV